ncbi:MAG: hypothetical protein IJT83_03245 [Victivallales bacterium]|nr:hypothetical protein [Victivallales bacterium]
MPLDIQSFDATARSAWFSSRNIVIDSNDVKLGRFLISPGQNANKATMSAFKEALRNEYGIFGLHAFEAVVGNRATMNKSLRSGDVRATISCLNTIRNNRYVNEVNRQLDISPKMMELPLEQRLQVRQLLHSTQHSFTEDLKGFKTQEEISRFAEGKINEAIAQVTSGAARKIMELGSNTTTEAPVRPDTPLGLSFLDRGTIIGGKRTSVEDHVKQGHLGPGSRINRSRTNPMLLDGLKKNGVEPGFIYHNDWSTDDTRGFMSDIYSKENKDAMEDLIRKTPDLEARRDLGYSYRELGLRAGRAHPAGLAFATEFVLHRELSKEGSPLQTAFKAKFPNLTLADLFPDDIDAEPSKTQKDNLRAVKKELFVLIRDTVMNIDKNDPDFGVTSVFKHFTDRHIVNLDYNEGDRFFKKDAAHEGGLRLPERVQAKKGNAIKNFFYQKFRISSPDKASAGAVTEAFANDLTRLMGVPSQELSLVRGEYSDGHPKLMLTAKFADGYKDFERGFLKDGQIVMPQGQPFEPIGKYKAIFLALADRDAIGSRGQNKGIVNGHFFAIDPGHSLEGNGPSLQIRDDLSFTDPKNSFVNYSIFDDDTRAAKLEGVRTLNALLKSGDIDTLASKYKEAFNPAKPGISAAERKLHADITAKIDRMVTEFKTQIQRMVAVCQPQLDLFEALKDDGKAIQNGAIETIANLEKLTSPTTWKSPKGEVNLKHLAVKPETRTPWTASLQGTNIVYTSGKPIDKTARTHLEVFATTAGVTCTFDTNGLATLTIPRASAQTAFNIFSEDNVSRTTHPPL